MTLKPQSIRKGVQIYLEGKLTEKQDIIKLSKDWSEPQINFFKKMLKQGGEFKIKGNKFIILPPSKVLDSKGEKDKGVITIPGLDSRF